MGMIYAPPSIIQNGALINDVCHIYQSIKPTARPDGSALVVRDKWYNTDTGVEGFWNGTYWLSFQQFKASTFLINGGAGGTSGTLISYNGSILVETIKTSQGYGSGTYNSSNYWTQRVGVKSVQSGSGDLVYLHSPVTINTLGFTTIYESPNIVVNMSVRNQLFMVVTQIGVPSNFSGGQSILYRCIL